MASSEKVFYSVFPIEGTVNDRGLILHVRESFFTASTTLVAGTTLENFMLSENPPKGDAITQGYGSYIYREQMSKEGNNLRFLFLKLVCGLSIARLAMRAPYACTLRGRPGCGAYYLHSCLFRCAPTCVTSGKSGSR